MNEELSDYRQLSRLVLKGYKSIAECELELRPLNVLIGANGAGKSNLIGFFTLIQQLVEGRLQLHVSRHGGPDAVLHYGRKKTPQLKAELYFGNNGYRMRLEPTVDNRMVFEDESFWWNVSGWRFVDLGHFESAIKTGTGTGIDQFVVPSMNSWRVYHFHDTSDEARVKQRSGIDDNVYLRQDASNLAAFLYLLQRKNPNTFRQIERTIQLVAPFFGGFHLRPSPDNQEQIELEWTEAGQDIPFKAHHLSDGTLRFICLTTLLLQPHEMTPSTILIDEPELGLHPYAITVLASLLKKASKTHQVIVSTQSVELINELDPEEIIVVDRKEGQSIFHRCSTETLTDWLEEYTLGELWKKNLLGGRPSK
ncbi:MAG: AAA family ATPase [Gammaproteobacteria bacterium]|nr:AAA family ATPase [Gammaproteobacteria bacterium]